MEDLYISSKSDQRCPKDNWLYEEDENDEDDDSKKDE